MTYSGQSIRRFEDPTLITGQGVFVEDFKLPGMLHAAVTKNTGTDKTNSMAGIQVTRYMTTDSQLCRCD